MKESFEDLFNPRVADAITQATSAAGFSNHLGIRVTDVSPGRIVCTIPELGDQHQSGVGAVHGGVMASLIDHTASLAVYPLVEVGRWVATLEFKVNYLGPVREGAIVSTGTVESLRKQLAVVRVEVDNDGRKVALGQATLFIRDKLS